MGEDNKNRWDGRLPNIKHSGQGYFEDETFIKTIENTMMGQNKGKQRLLMHERMVHYMEMQKRG